MKKTILLLFLLIVTSITVSGVDVNSCQTLTGNGQTWDLTQDVSTSGQVCFRINGDNNVLNLKGHTVNYANVNFNQVYNGDFELGNVGWDLSHASAEITQGEYYSNQVKFGDFGARIHLPASQSPYIKTSQPVTLIPGVEYIISAYAYNHISDNITVYMQLVDQNDNPILHEFTQEDVRNTFLVERAGIMWRGIQFIPQSQFTHWYSFHVNSNTNAYVKIWVDGPDIGLSGDIYIDGVKLLGAAYEGIVISGSGNRITNGNIMQASEDCFQCDAIASASNTEIDNLNIHTKGVQSQNIDAGWNSNVHIHHNTLTTDVHTVIVRDWGFELIDVTRTRGGLDIHDNNVLDSPQYGIRVSNYNSTIPGDNCGGIYNNYISHESKYTQAFGIGAYCDGLHVYDNVINISNGRGIHVGQELEKIYNNYIDIAEGRNQEYGGMTGFGIQIEGGLDNEIYGNTVIARTHPGNGAAAAMRITDDSGGNDIHDNTFIAIQEHEGLSAAAVYLYTASNPSTFSRNNFESNDRLVRLDRSNGYTFVNNTFKMNPGLSVPYTFQVDAFATGQELIDTILLSGTVLDSVIPTTGTFDFTAKYTVTVLVQDNRGDMLSGTIVTVRDNENEVVFSGTTGADGRVTGQVTEFVRSGSSGRTDYGPFTITANYLGTIQSVSADIDRTWSQNFTFDFSGITPSNIRCQTSAGWSNCSGLDYGDTITAVSVDCADSDGIITGAAFTLKNIDDDYTYFRGMPGSGSGTYMYSVSGNGQIVDSGDFELSATCSDNEGNTATAKAQWSVPWGVLSAAHQTPMDGYTVGLGNTMTFSTTVTCDSRDCGDVTASADPIAVWGYGGTFTGSADIIDGYIEYNNPDSNNMEGGQMQVWRYAYYPPGQYDNLGLLWFDIDKANVSSEGRINDCTLSMYYYTGQAWGGELEVHRAINDDWHNYYQTLTWNYLSPSGSITWTGGLGNVLSSFDPEVIDRMAYADIVDNRYVWDITPLCEGWIKGTFPNYGVWIMGESTDRAYLRASQTSTPQERPIITLNYSDDPKGIIPMNSGYPFYTVTQNPRGPTTLSCLDDMKQGDTCTTTWSVVSNTTTGNYSFFTIYESEYLEIDIVRSPKIIVIATETSSSCSLRYDVEPCDVLGITEVINAINGWYVNQISIPELIEHLRVWKGE